jgi:hypothetical protein
VLEEPALPKLPQARNVARVDCTPGALRNSINAGKSVAQLFRYLGGRRTKQLSGNFDLLIRDLIQSAPHAALNRDAYDLSRNNSVGVGERARLGRLRGRPARAVPFEEATSPCSHQTVACQHPKKNAPASLPLCVPLRLSAVSTAWLRAYPGWRNAFFLLPRSHWRKELG